MKLHKFRKNGFIVAWYFDPILDIPMRVAGVRESDVPTVGDTILVYVHGEWIEKIVEWKAIRPPKNNILTEVPTISIGVTTIDLNWLYGEC